MEDGVVVWQKEAVGGMMYDPGLIECAAFDWFPAQCLEDTVPSNSHVQSVCLSRNRVKILPNVENWVSWSSHSAALDVQVPSLHWLGLIYFIFLMLSSGTYL